MDLTKEHFDEQVALFNQRLDNTATKDGLTAVQTELKEIKETVQRIDQRDKEDSNAFAKDIVQLQKDVKQLKLKHA